MVSNKNLLFQGGDTLPKTNSSHLKMVGWNKKQLSNEKKPGWLGYIGDFYTPQLYRDYFINHEIRIPINHPGFFSWLNWTRTLRVPASSEV